MTLLEWVAECNYISAVTAKRGRVPEMNNDPATFIRYCEMQRNAALKEHHDDTATYIEHCIDDLVAVL